MQNAAPFEELVARARLGDHEAISELVRQYEPEVRIVARLRLGPALRPFLDSVDLVQSVHRSLMRGLQDEKFSFDGPNQLIALALTMVRRKAAHAWRKLRRQERLNNPNSDGLPEMLANLSSPEMDPARDVEYRDTVKSLCEQLEPLDRQLLELNLQGYRTVEVAQMLNKDPDVLRVRLSRLRQKLRSSGVTADW